MYSINLHPQEPMIEASALLALIDLWRHDREMALPSQTVDGYVQKLVYFQRWWSDVGEAEGWILKRSTLARFGRWLAMDARTKFDKPLSYHSTNDVLRRLGQVFRWAYQTDRIPVDLSLWLPAAQGSAPLRKALDLPLLDRLFAAAELGACPDRDQVVLAVFIGTGVRRAEAAALDASDVTIYADMSGLMTVRKAKKVRGRIVQGRVVAFDAATGQFLRPWVDAIDPGSPLFPRVKPGYELEGNVYSNTERLSTQGLYRIVNRCAAEAGITKEQLKGPHDLRRLFATTFARYRRGESHGQLLSMQLGHSSFAATVRNGYSLQDIEDVREVMFSPMALIRTGAPVQSGVTGENTQ